MADRRHLSIGEVLSLLQEEFPDITISKIRFLESQGLLDPERTPSGYRKFYESDIERLRWILRQQRQNFLPLKVIKDRLEENQRTGRPLDDPEPIGERPGPWRISPPAGGPDLVNGPVPIVVPPDFEASATVDLTEPDPPAIPVASPPVEAASPPSPAPPPAAPVPDPPAPPPAEPRPAEAPPVVIPPATPAPRPTSVPEAVSLTRDELAAAAGLTERVVADLERYGLVRSHVVGRDTLYDEEALAVARLAAGFLRFGVEARHLRMYKVAAEREAGFFEQVVMPMLKQRNPAARQRAADTLGELSSLGDGLRSAMLRQALRTYTGER